jgi:hypothetical protein
VYDLRDVTFEATVLAKTDSGFEILGQAEGSSTSATSISTERSSNTERDRVCFDLRLVRGC